MIQVERQDGSALWSQHLPSFQLCDLISILYILIQPHLIDPCLRILSCWRQQCQLCIFGVLVLPRRFFFRAGWSLFDLEESVRSMQQQSRTKWSVSVGDSLFKPRDSYPMLLPLSARYLKQWFQSRWGLRAIVFACLSWLWGKLLLFSQSLSNSLHLPPQVQSKPR